MGSYYIDLDMRIDLVTESAPVSPNGSDYETRWKLVKIKGREEFVPDENGTYVMRKGKPVRIDGKREKDFSRFP